LSFSDRNDLDNVGSSLNPDDVDYVAAKKFFQKKEIRVTIRVDCNKTRKFETLIQTKLTN